MIKILIGKITDSVVVTLKNLARLQTGNIQHYILYAFLFLLFLLILLLFKMV